MKKIVKQILTLVIVFAIVASFFSLFSEQRAKIVDITSNELVDQIAAGQVDKISVSGDELLIATKDKKQERLFKEAGQSAMEFLAGYGITAEQLRKLNLTIKSESSMNFWLNTILPFALPLLLMILIVFFMVRQLQSVNNRAMMFGQSTARENKPEDKKKKTTFKDVAGAKEAKEELEEVVEFLKNAKKFTSLGAKIPKGVLLMGAPGTGKTLIARAVAGEANVPFFHMSGSEFVEMFVGVGASRVRDLFNKAKKSAPCIIFIDEIDAVGRQRGSGLGGSHDEREQTLNQILVEMDGFEPNAGVILIAATNRPDVLDPALLRPGRFDRRVVIDMPDLKDREAILNVHCDKKPLDEGITMHLLAERTPGFSGADLGNLLNEAAILTARRNKKKIGLSELLESIEKVLLGPERKARLISDREKKIVAYHEAGHALVAAALPNSEAVHKLSIISRGHAAGYTLKLPIEDKTMHSFKDMVANIASLLGGFTAEKEIFGDVTTGASNDLEKATSLATQIVTRFGMDEVMGPRTFGAHEEMVFLGKHISEQRNFSEHTAEQIDHEVSKIIQNGYRTAKEVITKHRKKLDEIVAVLLKNETIEQEEFKQLVADILPATS